jgi:phosphomannomutase/phosphoglucomutase
MNQNIKIDPYGFREYDARWLYEKDISKEESRILVKVLALKLKNIPKKRIQE